jgi:hypothetical protein
VNKLLLVLVVGAGCKASTDKLPIGGGGGGGGTGGGGGGGTVDSPPSGDAGVLGRVCLAADPRDLVGCAATGAGGFTVTLGTSTATTAADGTFSFATPQGSGLVWHVTGTNIVTSVMPLATVAEIPALTITTYQDLLGNTGVVLSAGQGSVLARVVHAGAPVADAVATSSPAAQYQTTYDGATAQAWGTTATEAHGTAFLAGITAGAVTVTVTPSGASPIAVSAGVEDGALTFLAFDAP